MSVGLEFSDYELEYMVARAESVFGKELMINDLEDIGLDYYESDLYFYIEYDSAFSFYRYKNGCLEVAEVKEGYVHCCIFNKIFYVDSLGMFDCNEECLVIARNRITMTKSARKISC